MISLNAFLSSSRYGRPFPMHEYRRGKETLLLRSFEQPIYYTTIFHKFFLNPYTSRLRCLTISFTLAFFGIPDVSVSLFHSHSASLFFYRFFTYPFPYVLRDAHTPHNIQVSQSITISKSYRNQKKRCRKYFSDSLYSMHTSIYGHVCALIPLP